MAPASVPVAITPQLPRFQSHDHELLKSGKYADVEVKCETRTWALHRLILCSRCVWFDKALNGKFKVEGTTGSVMIHDFEPDKIDVFINYIYTGVLPQQNGQEAGYLKTLVGLYELGDYFMMPELCQDALNVLTDRLNEAVRIIQLQCIQGHPTQKTSSPDTTELHHPYEEFIQVVKIVYAGAPLSSILELRKMLVSFFERTQLFMMKNSSNDLCFNSLDTALVAAVTWFP
ncbi:hypothetical protein F5Y19DRAFT_475724 [Xylariaceae sp. FL1651]|nr:hypothetical protein F5Y19DRAFT_475724 [Xylariaceae sp. FL1651]